MWNDYEENIRLPPESGRLCAMIMILFRRRLLRPQLPSGADYYDCNRCRHEGVYLCVLYIRERVHSQLRGLNPLARIVFVTETKRYPIMYTRDKRLRIFRPHPPPPDILVNTPAAVLGRLSEFTRENFIAYNTRGQFLLPLQFPSWWTDGGHPKSYIGYIAHACNMIYIYIYCSSNIILK